MSQASISVFPRVVFICRTASSVQFWETSVCDCDSRGTKRKQKFATYPSGELTPLLLTMASYAFALFLQRDDVRTYSQVLHLSSDVSFQSVTLGRTTDHTYSREERFHSLKSLKCLVVFTICLSDNTPFFCKINQQPDMLAATQ